MRGGLITTSAVMVATDKVSVDQRRGPIKDPPAAARISLSEVANISHTHDQEKSPNPRSVSLQCPGLASDIRPGRPFGAEDAVGRASRCRAPSRETRLAAPTMTRCRRSPGLGGRSKVVAKGA
jgi:hypothetical protein